MVTTVACPTPILQFFNNAGQFNAGGHIQTTVGGINAPTYQDFAGTVPLPNPIPLNSRGEVSNASGASCQLFLPINTVYVFTIYDKSGNIIDQANYVNGFQLVTLDSLNLHYDQTLQEIAASVIPTIYAYDPRRGEDVWRFGATGNGATDDRGAFTSANNVATSIYVAPGTYRIATNLTISVPITFDGDAILKPDPGVTITINGAVSAGNVQIFDLSNFGSLIAGTLGGVGNVFWWGAKGNWNGTSGNDDTVPIQNALNAAGSDSNTGNFAVYVPFGNYKITAVLNFNHNNTTLYALGGQYTGAVFYPIGNFGNAVFSSVGTALAVKEGVYIRNILIDFSGATATYGFYFIYTFNITIENCQGYGITATLLTCLYFGVLGSAIQLYNNSFLTTGDAALVGTGIVWDGNTGEVVGNILETQLGGFNLGMVAQGAVILTCNQLYMDTCVTCYQHSVTGAGFMVSMFGGQLQAINNGGGTPGLCVQVNGDNLLIDGMALFGNDTYNCVSIPTTTKLYRNVAFKNIPDNGQLATFFFGTPNLACVVFDPPVVASLLRRPVDFSKISAAGSVNLLSIQDIAEFAYCKLRLEVLLGTATAIYTYEFTITGGAGYTTAPQVSSVVSTAGPLATNATFGVTLTSPLLTPSAPNNGTTVVSVTLGATGTSGSGGSPRIIGHLDMDVFDNSGSGNTTGVVLVL